MDVFDAITNRRSSGIVTDEAVDENLLEELLQAAAWAPTHHRTEPWRFCIFTGKGRETLQQAMMNGTRVKYYDDPELEKKVAKKGKKVFRAPVIVAVWAACGRGDKKNPPVWEDHAAVAAAVQNFMLAAHAKGLATFWRSGDVCDMAEVQALMTTPEDSFEGEKGDKILGFIYVGWPDESRPQPLRPTPKLDGKINWYR